MEHRELFSRIFCSHNFAFVQQTPALLILGDDAMTKVTPGSLSWIAC